MKGGDLRNRLFRATYGGLLLSLASLLQATAYAELPQTFPANGATNVNPG